MYNKIYIFIFCAMIMIGLPQHRQTQSKFYVLRILLQKINKTERINKANKCQLQKAAVLCTTQLAHFKTFQNVLKFWTFWNVIKHFISTTLCEFGVHFHVNNRSNWHQQQLLQADTTTYTDKHYNSFNVALQLNFYIITIQLTLFWSKVDCIINDFLWRMIMNQSLDAASLILL